MVLVLFYDLLYSNFGQTDYPQKINEEVKLLTSIGKIMSIGTP